MQRRFRPPRRAAVLIVVAATAWVAVRWWQDTRGPDSPEALAEGDYRVARVVDGDTLLLTNGARVRLIGVDTPETVREGHPVEPFGLEAAAFTERFLSGRDVRLTFDRERVDQYDRFLAYAWVDGRLLNEELLRAGLARASLHFNYSDSKKTLFRKAQEEARRARRGIWADER